MSEGNQQPVQLSGQDLMPTNQGLVGQITQSSGLTATGGAQVNLSLEDFAKVYTNDARKKLNALKSQRERERTALNKDRAAFQKILEESIRRVVSEIEHSWNEQYETLLTQLNNWSLSAQANHKIEATLEDSSFENDQITIRLQVAPIDNSLPFAGQMKIRYQRVPYPTDAREAVQQMQKLSEEIETIESDIRRVNRAKLSLEDVTNDAHAQIVKRLARDSDALSSYASLPEIQVDDSFLDELGVS